MTLLSPTILAMRSRSSATPPRTRPSSISSPGASTCCSADSVAVSEGLLKTDQGKDFEFVGPAYTDPKWFG